MIKNSRGWSFFHHDFHLLNSKKWDINFIINSNRIALGIDTYRGDFTFYLNIYLLCFDLSVIKRRWSVKDVFAEWEDNV